MTQGRPVYRGSESQKQLSGWESKPPQSRNTIELSVPLSQRARVMLDKISTLLKPSTGVSNFVTPQYVIDASGKAQLDGLYIQYTGTETPIQSLNDILRKNRPELALSDEQVASGSVTFSATQLDTIAASLPAPAVSLSA
jgi:hypothetical protein